MFPVAFDIDQSDARRCGEFGVQADHFNREGDLVGDALTGTMSTGEKLKIFKAIVLSVSVDVMNGLLGEKSAPEMLGHDPAVLHNSVFFTSNERRNGNPHITVPLDMTLVFAAIKSFKRNSSLIGRLALLTTKFLLRIVFCIPSRSFVLPSRNFFAAFKAIEKLVSFGFNPAAQSSALARAVQRITPVHTVASIDCAKIGRERFAAMLANKKSHFCWFPRHLTLLSFGNAEHSRMSPLCQAIGI